MRIASIGRSYSSSPEPNLKETLRKIIPEKRELLKQVKAVSDKKLGDLKVESALGGMRWVRCRFILKSDGIGVSNV
jgi:citrate synthase